MNDADGLSDQSTNGFSVRDVRDVCTGYTGGYHESGMGDPWFRIHPECGHKRCE